MIPQLYGTSPYVPDAPFLDADELSRQTGGNTGNLMFCYAISRILDASPASVSWGSDVSHLSADRHRLVLPLANQLGPHVDLKLLAERMGSIHIPLVGIGLGAQGPIGGVDADSIPEGSWEWLRVLTSKSATDRPNISLRGQTTYDAIAKKGLAEKCVITGCPSNFINPSATLGRQLYRRRANGLRRVVVAAGNPFLPQFRKLEQSLVRLVDLHDGLYVCQHPIDLLRLHKQELRHISKANLLRYKDYIHPELSPDSFLAWFRSRSHAFTSVPEWLSLMQGYDVVVGTRIHGVMAGIQAGVPSVCLCIDSRTLELCRTMMIPHVDANDYRNGISLQQIGEILQKWEWKLFDDNRRMLADRFTRFFRDNQLEAVGAPRSVLKGVSVSVSTAAAQMELPAHAQTHQTSTSSFEDRYNAIFSGLNRAVDKATPDILSFGCADGFELNDLARKHFHHARIVGIDVDPVALRIAEFYNQHPDRVDIVDNASDVDGRGPFDAVVCMTVLCRWPEARDASDISTLYPFTKFASTVEYLVSRLRIGGVLAVYNAHYAVTDTPAAECLEVVEMPDQLPHTQQVHLFDRNGRPAVSQQLNGVLFRRVA